MRILLATLDAALIEFSLREVGFNVYATDDADETVDLGRLYDYDIILLGDITFAHRTIQQLRTAKCKTPILRLSSLACSQDVAAALNAGADDHITLPVEPLELVARIHAIVRRTRGHAQSVVECGPLCLNLNQRTCTLSGSPFHLTGKEYAMLELLALRKGSLITKEMFLNHLYGGMDEPEIKIIDVFICKIRKRLGANAGLIQTVWGRGYVLGEPAAATEDVGAFTNDPPVRVSLRTPIEAHAREAALRFGPSPPLVPAQGQK